MVRRRRQAPERDPRRGEILLDAGWPRPPRLAEPREAPRRRLWPWLLLASTLAGAAVAGLVVAEVRTSEWQSRELSRYAGELTFALAPGPSQRWHPPTHGPFDARLGYTQLAEFQRRLLQRDFGIEQQARFSPALMRYAERGFFPPYREKTQAGLELATCRGEPLYRFRHPERHYPDYASIPLSLIHI